MDTTELHVIHPGLIDPHPLLDRMAADARHPEDLAVVATPSPRLAGHLRSLSPDPPVAVPCRPFHGAQPGLCYQNVVALGDTLGGTFVTGWAVWEDPGVAFVCDHHAVWRTPEGELVCVTPQVPAEPEILFVVQRAWDEMPSEDTLGPLIAHHYFPAGDDPRLAAVCELRRAASRCPQQSPEYRCLHNRAMAVRGRFLARQRERQKKRRRRQGRK